MPGVLDDSYLNAIKGFEGYQPSASWDYSQYTNGYGTKAAYPGERIDRDTAEQRFRTEIGRASDTVDSAFPQLPAGARAALTSLTYNAGPGWINSGLGGAVRAGDWATARQHFLQYNRAGGQVLPGLANRRAQEAAWLGGNTPQETGSAPLSAASVARQSTPAGVPLFAQPQQPMQASAEPMMAMAQTPQMPDLLPPAPAVDYSGLQRLLRGRRGYA